MSIGGIFIAIPQTAANYDINSLFLSWLAFIIFPLLIPSTVITHTEVITTPIINLVSPKL